MTPLVGYSPDKNQNMVLMGTLENMKNSFWIPPSQGEAKVYIGTL